MKLSVSYPFLPHTPTTRASIVMDHFGIGFEQGDHTIVQNLELPVQPGQIVLFTGASGSGKSSLMRTLSQQLVEQRQQTVLPIDTLNLGQKLVIDSIDLPIDEALRLLNSCGLGEAQLLLRNPQELSDGQRYRLRLAQGLSRKPQWIVADEFTATLDRTLAQVVSFNLRKLATRTGTGFLLATTHTDIVADLQPDLHIDCQLDGEVVVRSRGQAESPEPDPENFGRKKKASPSRTSFGSHPRPKPTGRTSLGGITAVTTSG